MKHLVASAAIGALLLSSAGAALAADPHSPTNPKGQPGTFSPGGVSCQTFTTTPGNAGSSNGSPFNPNVTKEYAGNPGNPTGPGGTANNSPHAVSEYDVACFQQSSKQMP
jgi:hypothetical protein